MTQAGTTESGAVTGELKKWHRVTITFGGPETKEKADPNPFRDYRLGATFSQGDKKTTVAGFYAADGNAGETRAQSGGKWRVRFLPNREGKWSYKVSFRQGRDIAVNPDPKAGNAVAFDGASGTFEVGPTDKQGCDHRGQGLLRYVGRRYLQFAESGEYFLKGGADSPENFLAYADFDGTYDSESLDREGEARGDKFIHSYAPHGRDWGEGDPTWRGGKGKNIIGALNYLAGKGMNSVYMLTMNVGGDGKDIWPWTSDKERYRFDCSKLDQWEIVFSHMDRLGMQLHLITQETENDQLLDGGELGLQRKLYYRELIARFGHHHALVWNLGEENTNTDRQRRAFAEYIRGLDPYDHPIVVHTYPNPESWYEKVYAPLLGFAHFEGASLQTVNTHALTIEWLDRSEAAGRQWFVCLDEVARAHEGVKPDKDDYEHDEIRKNHLWGNLMAGGGGVEWYFGYKYAHNDLSCEDWRSREHMWDLTRYALEFFQQYLPFERMSHHDELTTSKEDYCLAEPGKVYVVYLPEGGTTGLELKEVVEEFTVQWYNPRRGGKLKKGTIESVSGPGTVEIGLPPEDADKDWAALIRIKK